MSFHDFQIDASKKVINLLESGAQSLLLYSPTASGKTYIGAKIIMDLPKKYKRVLFVVNREALLDQTYETLCLTHGIKTFIVHNTITHTRNDVLINKDGKGCKVLITLIGSRDNIDVKFKPDLIIIDEAHKGTSMSFQDLVEYYGCPVVGLTATPHRAKDKDGESLSEWYGDNLITTIPYRELVRRGFLTPLKYVSLSDEAHVVNTWLKYTEGDNNKRTILFTKDTTHSLEVKEAFLSNGINAEIITSGDGEGKVANQPNKVRNEIYRKFRAGEIDVLISVMALCEGFDEPAAKYCFICRKMSKNNVSLFHQICGRVGRLFEDKDFGHVIDFGGNYDRFGSLEDYEFADLSYSNYVKTVSNGDLLHHNAVKKRLMMRCHCCDHVYDAIKNPRCIHCDTPNTVKFYSSVGDLKKKLVETIPSEAWEKFKRANKFISKNEANESAAFKVLCAKAQLAVKTMKEADFNKMYFSLFAPMTWEINPEFSWILKIKSNVKMEDNLEWSMFESEDRVIEPINPNRIDFESLRTGSQGIYSG